MRPQHGQWREELTELPKGRLRMKFTLSSLEEVEQWILSFGTHATVIEPRELKGRIQAAAREISQRYGKNAALEKPATDH
jgi:predicted DNA-binding transcriptional regulator YafY